MYRLFKVPEDRNVQRNITECNFFSPYELIKLPTSLFDEDFSRCQRQIVHSNTDTDYQILVT